MPRYPKKIQKLFDWHPNPRLQIPWNVAQIGVLIFPLLPTLGALALFLSLAGVWRQRYRQIIRYPLNWGFAIWSLWLIVASSFADKPLDAFPGLANFVPFFVLFAAFSVLMQTPQQLRRLSWILVISSIPVVILGVGQMVWGWTTPVQWQAVLGWVLEAQGNPPGRMASVFMYANILAAYLVIVFSLGLGLWVELVSAVRGQRFFWKLGFLTVAVIINAIALVLTNSRNAWGVAIFASLAFALYQGWRCLVAGVAGAGAAVLGAAFSPPPLRTGLRVIVPAYFWARLTDQLYPDRPVALMRVTQWRFAMSLTQQRPWMGWGLRNFTPLYEQQMNLWLGHPHNLLLMLAAETGIPATVLFFSLVGWVLIQGVLLVAHWSSRLHQDRVILFSYLIAFGGCILFNAVDVTLFDLRVNTIGWLLLSTICGVVYHGENGEKERKIVPS
ncbi:MULTISPECIES: O-antigen ligase family protein [unclassified Coleofasciculus]|uniref:O-antigen ligase family protein n=1 Tax=unclassified Coleofasciculus TaxID=2692782 RepID=UPI00187F25DA|nr:MULTISPECIES: O-antigen ligase family protein [unclassified Coleofasciculus]MBE9125042.1 O-antigen ligase family protein [Coleofasciculus sp. LEGE 07081]MBE9147638.1 O-antigen ligase family protein [Coleofasciculus sp. LEGE 07092]